MLRETLRFRVLKIPKGLEVLELGCVPGGTTQFLLENQYKVLGVDPGKMDARISSEDNFKFYQMGAHEFKVPKDSKISVITSDINLNPIIVLKECQRIAKHLRSLRFILVTCKMNDPRRLKDVKNYLRVLKEMGCR